MKKRVIFLLGSMGAGKSTLLNKATETHKSKYIVHCKEFDVLGTSLDGADTLSSFKKADVLDSLRTYSGVLIVAGVFYTAKQDIARYKAMGFKVITVMLKVPRDIVYDRVVARGRGGWKESTYISNAKSIVKFYEQAGPPRIVLPNITPEHKQLNWQRLQELANA